MRNRYRNGVSVVPYRPEWEHQARGVATTLWLALEGVQAEAVEHVGSTSVPGLAAKPILDIDVIVQRQAMATAIVAL